MSSYPVGIGGRIARPTAPRQYYEGMWIVRLSRKATPAYLAPVKQPPQIAPQESSQGKDTGTRRRHVEEREDEEM